jgi:hypothetical protein
LSGYGYEYRKTPRLIKGKSEMELGHSLKNIGKKVIETQVYNHNFPVIDGKGPPSGTMVTLPFAVSTRRKPNPKLAAIEGTPHAHRGASTPSRLPAPKPDHRDPVGSNAAPPLQQSPD